ncbi:MAG: hypothetical protein KDN19_14160 [Verrucomicrobiae bacterium]|nr:hypothetical protein [Verrucomicrobiae bacterium]
MTSLKPQRPPLLLAAIAGLSLATLPTELRSEDPSFGYRFQKFHSGASDPPSNLFGAAVAQSDRFFLIGEQGNDDAAPGAGAAWVFDARTGRRLRKLAPAELNAGASFGSSVAACGNLGLIGAISAEGAVIGSGAAFLYDLRNGRLIRKLKADTGTATDYFGFTVAMSSDYHVVGAFGAEGARGRVYVFDAQNGELVSTLAASDDFPAVFFGSSLALDGPILAVGATGADGVVSGSGAVYLFNLSKPDPNMNEVAKITSSDGTSGDRFGASVALDGNVILVGAPEKNSGASESGAAYLINYIFGGEHAILHPSDPSADLHFGTAVAMEGEVSVVGCNSMSSASSALYRFDGIERNATLGTINESDRIPVPGASDSTTSRLDLYRNRLLLSAQTDNDLGFESGAAYLLEDLVGPTPLETKAQRGGFVPSAVDTKYRSFQPPVITWADPIAFCANFTGVGASGGRNKGLCAGTTSFPNLDLFTRTGDDIGTGVRIRKIDDLINNYPSHSLIQARVGGGGVNGTNNRFVWAMNSPGSFVQIVRTGTTGLLGGGGESFLSFPQVTQAVGDYIGVSYRLRPGAGGVNRTNDSGVMVLDHAGAPLDIAPREGDEVPTSTGYRYLQFFHRNATQGPFGDPGRFAYGCFVVQTAPGSLPTQVVVKDSVPADPTGVAFQGIAAPDAGTGVVYRSFLGESIDGMSASVAYRGVVAGNGVTSANNEGIWYDTFLIARKGEEPDPTGEPGVRIARFLKVWQSYGTGVFILAKLRGPGVNARNDCVLLGWTATDGTGYRCLFREGQAVAGNDGARVGVIQRIDVEPDAGRVIILCSLAGGDRQANQALFVGRVGNPNADLRVPWMILRKGTDLRSRAFVNTAIRSLMIRNSDDRTGFGAKGLGKSIEDQIKMALLVTYDNRAVEIATGDF